MPILAIPTVSNLVVSVENVRSAQGQVCAALYRGSAGFPNDPSRVVKSFCVDVTDPATVRLEIDALPLGTYALALFHDENSDGKLNTGTFGIPKEGFAFSNNPPVRIGSPAYSECAFFVAGKETTLSVAMKNL